MKRRDEATERQVQAASPQSSTWLSANAGSGKTRVLTDRVARLLLDGVLPQHILCLTYTKAAAGEMQNRLFKRLGAWAMLDDAALIADLQKLGLEGGICKGALKNARRLFARAIETPGGLKIQTIHSFCAALLRRFPLEAGVSPQFTEMDERAANLLRADIVEEMAAGADMGAVDALAQHYTSSDFDRLCAEIARHRAAFETPQDAGEIWGMFDLAPEMDEAEVLAQVIMGSEGDLLARLIPALQAGSAMDQRAAGRLRAIDLDNIRLFDVITMESTFLFGEKAADPFGAKIDQFPTRKTRDSLGDILASLNDLMARVEGVRNTRISLYAARKTLALTNFASVFLPRYEARKQQLGWLDFDDLILITGKLLNNPLVAQWVLFRLDGGIDHILVDEAQDTSPAQWQVIKLLAQEFTTGIGAHTDQPRTIFVVGDKKQSIYSFQGADPQEFDRMQAHFHDRLAQVDQKLVPSSLEYSFRSAEAIMRLVDYTFQERADLGLGGEMTHRAFKTEMPGRVDLWPLVPKAGAPEKQHWYDPTDMPAGNHESIVLAQEIARNIKKMCDDGTLIPEEVENTGRYLMRPVHEGDFLILVQGRVTLLFSEIIRACKAAGLAVAGADRLKIGAELAVKDLTALLAFLATPEDDLSLAAALRSPLFGWSEQALFDLAHKRAGKTYLWAGLRARRDEFPETLTMLDNLRKDADYLRPFELLERILTRFHGRKNLLARLGVEAEDGIDALLSQALAYERTDVPGLTGFLTWLQVEEVEIKRQMDSAGRQIRVMTVHGAKGLEAPIVILPDTVKRPRAISDELYRTADGHVIWQVPAAVSPKQVALAREKLNTLQAEERLRLLYVAMTRAEKWLIICGAGEPAKDGNSWYSLAEGSMQTAGAVAHDFALGSGLQMLCGDWLGETADEGDASPESDTNLPEWAKNPAPTPARIAKTLSPSGLGGAKAQAGEGDGLSEVDAVARGLDIHLLLEHLPNHPQAQWQTVADALLLDAEPGVFNETKAVLTNPDLAFLFQAETLAEAPITATIPELNNARIHGTIDRLLITRDRVLAVDFKSNAVVPNDESAVPDGILRQLGAYRAALAQIYPDHRIDCAVLWTKTARLMEIEHERVTAALRTASAP